MEIIFENQFILIKRDAKQSLVIDQWKQETVLMTDAQYRATAEEQVKNLENLNPKNWVVNMSQLGFALVPKTQEWADTILFPRILKAGIKKIAFIISPDIFAQISVEQLMDEKNVKTAEFEIHYFDTESEALAWF